MELPSAVAPLALVEVEFRGGGPASRLRMPPAGQLRTVLAHATDATAVCRWSHDEVWQAVCERAGRTGGSLVTGRQGIVEPFELLRPIHAGRRTTIALTIAWVLGEDEVQVAGKFEDLGSGTDRRAPDVHLSGPLMAVLFCLGQRALRLQDSDTCVSEVFGGLALALGPSGAPSSGASDQDIVARIRAITSYPRPLPEAWPEMRDADGRVVSWSGLLSPDDEQLAPLIDLAGGVPSMTRPVQAEVGGAFRLTVEPFNSEESVD